jgi:hypothetical protein
MCKNYIVDTTYSNAKLNLCTKNLDNLSMVNGKNHQMEELTK